MGSEKPDVAQLALLFLVLVAVWKFVTLAIPLFWMFMKILSKLAALFAFIGMGLLLLSADPAKVPKSRADSKIPNNLRWMTIFLGSFFLLGKNIMDSQMYRFLKYCIIGLLVLVLFNPDVEKELKQLILETTPVSASA